MAARIDQQQPASEASPAEVSEVLARVLESRHFVHAPKKQKFIRLICEFYLAGRAGELNEYLLGREVFGRDNSYNPAADPIVRVGAHDVRKKLELYYQGEGAGDALRLVVPVGSYEPVFLRQPACRQPEDAGAGVTEEKGEGLSFEGAVGGADSRQSGVAGKWLWLVGGMATLLVMAVVILVVINRRLQREVEQAAHNQVKDQAGYGAVWEPFVRNNAPTLLILSNPTVHRSANEADPEVVTRRGIRLTPEQARELTSAAGNRLPVKPDRPVQLIPAFNMYTGIGEAIGIYRLAGLLQAAGEQTLLKQSRNISSDDLKQYDVILLGSVYSNQWSKPLSIRENFVYSDHGTIENLDPRAGEEREYRAAFDQRTGMLIEDYALVSVTPGVSGENTMMVLAGLYSEG
ncbi:MAG TPA: hypothetical protein VFD58_18390, partial [Blastocatellia bacterium]|nr:hypothetical protein [Blastocatellia bacterium]